MRNVTFVVVHGIGPVKPGDTRRAILRAAADEFGDGITATSDIAEQEFGRLVLTESHITSQQLQVRLTEVHWKAAVGAIRRWRPDALLVGTLSVIGTLRLLPLIENPSASRRLANWLYAFVYGTLVVALVLMSCPALALAIALPLGRPEWMIRRTMFLDGEPHADLWPAEFYVTGIFFVFLLAVVAALSLAASLALTPFKQAAARSHAYALALMSSLGVIVGTGFATLVGYPFFTILLAIYRSKPTTSAIVLPLMTVFVVVAALIMTPIINLIRDVVYYLSPTRTGLTGPRQQEIVDGLRAVLEEQLSHSDRLVVVGHSLGSVIATDALRRLPANLARTSDIHLVTAGSPLRRLISRLIPGRPCISTLETDLLASRRIRTWLNSYRLFDYVGQALSWSHWLPFRRSSRIVECLIWRAPPFYMGHSDYWRDPRFVRLVTDTLVNRPPALPQGSL